MKKICDYYFYVVRGRDCFRAVCPALRLSGYGASAEEAVESLREHMKTHIAVMKGCNLGLEIPPDSVVTFGSIGVAV